MLADLDVGLVEYLSANTLAGEQLRIDLEPPTKEWSSRRTGPALNLFLADIREDSERREANPIDIRDEQGNITARRPAPRFFNVTYLLTAWTATPEDDHRLLGSALVALLRQDFLPFEHVRGELGHLAESGFPLLMRVGMRSMSEKAYSELMTAVGGEYRPSLSVSVSIPIPTGIPEPAGPPQTQPPQFNVGNTRDNSEESVRGADPTKPDSGFRSRTRPHTTPAKG